MKRKIISTVLALIMILSLAPYALADGTGVVETRTGTINWSISGTALTISGTGEIPDDFSADELDLSSRISITKLVVGSGITDIGSRAFDMLKKLETADLAASVENIGESAFRDLQYLYKVTMPGVIAIGDYAFSRTAIYEESAPLPENLAAIGKSAFAGTYYTEFNLPASVSVISEDALGSSQLSHITVAEGNQNYCDEDGILFNLEKTELLCYPAKHRLKEWDMDTTPEYEPDVYTVPSSVRRIYGYAFNDALYLGKIILPESVEEIGMYAFNTEVLTEIDTMANIDFTYENGVLYDAAKTWVYTGLVKSVPEKLVIADGVKYIDNSSFSGCGITELVLPESLAWIGRLAFADCESLEKVTMYKGVQEIEKNAFAYDTGITSVQFNGTKPAWKRIEETSGYGNTPLFSAEVTYSDPDGIDEPEIFNFQYLEEADTWDLEIYSGMLDMEYTAIAALYDNQTNALIEAKNVYIMPDSVMGNARFSTSVGANGTLDARLVVFCWDSMDGIKPLWSVPLTARTKEQ